MNLSEISWFFIGIVLVTGNAIVLVPRSFPRCPRKSLVRVAVVFWIVVFVVYACVRIVPRSRFLTASADGDMKTVRQRLAGDPSLLNARGLGDYTALHWAARNNQVEMVEFFVDRGVDMDADAMGETPFGIAVGRGHYESVELMLSKGVDVNQRSYRHDSTAVHIAAVNGHAKIVKLLIEHGADVNLPDLYGNGTPLADATSEETRELLRRHGAEE
ncbi:MAG: ankyrin repeat domain-containing protein [Candidatus Nealsonbacteria bacterium]|nr:ankyrin repeat domain-containing protein [Candidatus Nealsonbacteria bacterium]